MRTLALTILTMGIVLTTGHVRAQTYNPAFRQVGSTSPAPAVTGPDSYCLQGCQWGYPGNCQFSSYAQCMATASGTGAPCGINPRYAVRALAARSR